MKVFVTGVGGQLGNDLDQRAAAHRAHVDERAFLLAGSRNLHGTTIPVVGPGLRLAAHGTGSGVGFLVRRPFREQVVGQRQRLLFRRTALSTGVSFLALRQTG